jgi:hypothetical protein
MESRHDSLAVLLSIRVLEFRQQQPRPFLYHNKGDCSALRIGCSPLGSALQAPLEDSFGLAAIMTTHAFFDSFQVEEG